MRISSLQLRKLVTKIVSTQSSQILRIFFFAFTFIGQRVDTTVKIILTKKHIKSAGMFNQQKCWLKVIKCLWTSLIFIHASAKIYVSIWAPTVHCEIGFFLHTYASSKKTLHCSEVESKAVLNLHFFPNFHTGRLTLKCPFLNGSEG